ncbi:type II secretion system F family protein [Virgibacillus proomii]|uniref:type II secretion system F family protein n=1 Tax=Virgibacillus proomii TaxID=84407 RepID=UPI001C11278C|nr:type II secretion system F family protein [Virgibacillus proomii]MBU5265689.1 type II secretion system F family protein [Virgibacillus proomii]
MPLYKYVVRAKKGKVKRGTIESVSKHAAIKQLQQSGVNLREIKETKETIFNKNLSLTMHSVKNRDFVIYCRQFATLIRAGISIVEATNILAQQTDSKALKKALLQVEDDVREGQAYSTAIKKQPKIFPVLFVNMIRAGEMIGNLDETLDRLATYYEKQYTLKRKVQSTMTYPIILFVLILVVVSFMLIFVVPNFVTIFDQFDGEIPAITKIVMKLSEIVKELWWLVLLILMVCISTFIALFKRNKTFHYGVHLVILKLPVFGKVLQKSAIARMTRTLASLFASSVPILDALEIVEKVVGNPIIRKVVRESHDNLERGSPLSEPLADSWVFPPLVSQMVAIGEQTGSLDYMLMKIADFYEQDVDRTVDALKSLIEPVMIIFLATIVGFIVLAILIPMFTVFTEIQ